MKIVQALGWYFPESLGGTEIYVAGLSKRLQSAGHQVLIAAPDPALRRERTYEHDGLPVYRYPIPSSPTRDECQGVTLVRGAELFQAWLAKQKPDVVHVHTFVTGLGLNELKVARAIGAKVVVTTHASSLGYICQRGTMMQWGETLCDGVCQTAKCAACELQHRGLPKPVARIVGAIPPGIGGLSRNLPGKLGTILGMSNLIARNQTMQRQMLETVDRFVLLTDRALETVARNDAPREKLVLNRLGLSQTGVSRKPHPDEQPTQSPIRVGYLGRFERLKGVHDLARAMASLPQQTPIHLEFRGPALTDAERKLLGELQAIVGRDPRVTFAPPVSAAEAIEVLKGYDALCCPSLCLEGGPTVAIEAHAVGTPVIGTAIGGLAEMVTDGVNGRLVKPGDWRALADVLRQVISDPRGTVDRWRVALPAVRTMDQVTSEYLAVYRA